MGQASVAAVIGLPVLAFLALQTYERDWKVAIIHPRSGLGLSAAAATCSLPTPKIKPVVEAIKGSSSHKTNIRVQ